MVLAHDRREPALERAEEIAEAAVAVAVGMDGPVLLPEHHSVTPGFFSSTASRPVGSGRRRSPGLTPGGRTACSSASSVSSAGKGQLSRRVRALEVLLDGAARHPEPGGDVAHAHAVRARRSICRNCLMVSFLFGMRFSSCRRGGDARVADPGESRLGKCPVIDWNGVRLHSRNAVRLLIGIPVR